MLEAHPRSTRFFLRELWDVCQMSGPRVHLAALKG